MNGIYVIVDPEHTNGRSVVDVSDLVFGAGAAAVQLRDKFSDKRVVTERARKIQGLASAYRRIFIVNDHADVARIVSSDGLHVGQNDLSVGDCRKVLLDHQIVGTSNATLSEAQESEKQQADYIAVGAVFPTDTKSDTRPAGLETLKAVRRNYEGPIVAIGGINSSNLVSVVEAGASSICVASAVTKAQDIRSATIELVELFDRCTR